MLRRNRSSAAIPGRQSMARTLPHHNNTHLKIVKKCSLSAHHGMQCRKPTHFKCNSPPHLHKPVFEQMSYLIATSQLLATRCRGSLGNKCWRMLASSSDSNSQQDTQAVPDEQDTSSETVAPKKADAQPNQDENELVEMWNKDAPAGPEWNGPRGYEPTRHGDWSRNGRVSDF